MWLLLLVSMDLGLLPWEALDLGGKGEGDIGGQALMSRSLELRECLRASWEALDPVLRGSSVLGRAQSPLSPSNSTNDWKIVVPARS